jgi:hypothetical protein
MPNVFDKTSFIPQKSLSVTSRKQSSISLFFVLAMLLFLISIGSYVAVVSYKAVLEQSIESKAASLQRAKEAFDPGLIEDLIELNNRIESSKDILSNHTSITPLLELLEELTLKNVRFSQFEFNKRDSGQITLLLTGQAKNYASVVLQSDSFGQSRFLNSQIFSNVNLDSSGNVGFVFDAIVDPDLVSFKNNVEGF